MSFVLPTLMLLKNIAEEKAKVEKHIKRRYRCAVTGPVWPRVPGGLCSQIS
jgi:hypothetical protein